MRGLTWETCLPHQPLLGQNLHGLDGLKREKKMTHHRRGYSKVSFLEELCLQSHEASENKRFMLHPRCVRVKRLSDSHSRCCRLRCTPAWQRRRSPGVVQEGGGQKVEQDPMTWDGAAVDALWETTRKEERTRSNTQTWRMWAGWQVCWFHRSE